MALLSTSSTLGLALRVQNLDQPTLCGALGARTTLCRCHSRGARQTTDTPLRGGGIESLGLGV